MENLEEKINKIEERLDKLEEENTVLKIKFADSIIAQWNVEEAKQNLINNQIIENEKYIAKVTKECDRIEQEAEILRGMCRKLERENNGLREMCQKLEYENKVLISNCSNLLLDEVIKQAKEVKSKTKQNVFKI